MLGTLLLSLAAGTTPCVDDDAAAVRALAQYGFTISACYYRGAPEPAAIAEAHAAGTLAVSVHLRNGDTARLRNPGHKLRYTRAVDLVPMMSAVAELPSRCDRSTATDL